MARAVEQGRQLHARPDVEGADALGRVELVPGDGQQVDAQVIHVHRDLADGLGRVGVHQRAVAMGDLGQLSDGLDGAHLVVGVHDGHQQGVGGDGLFQVSRVHPTVRIHRQHGDAEALCLQPGADLGDGRMLDGRGDDVLAPLGGAPGQCL